jgi:hypothetical protein
MVLIAAQYPMAAQEPQSLRTVAEEIFSESPSPSQAGISSVWECARRKFEDRGLGRLLAQPPLEKSRYLEERTRIESELLDRFALFSNHVPSLQEAAFHVFEVWDRAQRPEEKDDPQFLVPESCVDEGMSRYLEELRRYRCSPEEISGTDRGARRIRR